MIRLRRYSGNPILTGREGVWWDSKYAYNAGAAIHEGKVHLLYRAEGDEKRKDIETRFPVSRLGLAISRNGYEIDERPTGFALGGEGPEELWGVEDPRVTKIGDTYYLVYVQVAPPRNPTADHSHLALATTKDFRTYTRHGQLMPEIPQRTSGLLPEKVNGKYVLIHRIRPNMQIAYSEDLVAWRDSRTLMAVRPGKWDSNFIGIGAQPLKTEKGWLLFYHGTDADRVYRLGAAWLDLDDPSKILARLEEPILEPDAPYEAKGLTPNVAYACGAVELNGEFLVYYGGADAVLGVASIGVEELLRAV